MNVKLDEDKNQSWTIGGKTKAAKKQQIRGYWLTEQKQKHKQLLQLQCPNL